VAVKAGARTWWGKIRQYSVSADLELLAVAATITTTAVPIPSTKLQCSANGIVSGVWELWKMAATAAGAF